MEPCPEAVLFDMDGTLFDSELQYCRAYQQTMENHGGTLTRERYFSEFAGRTNAFIESALGPELGHEFNRIFPIEWRKEFDRILQQEGPQLKPGVKEALDHLKKRAIPLAVASSNDKGEIQRLLELAGLTPWFPVIAGGDEVQNGKPAPDIFLLAAQRLGVAASHCLVIEDSNHGVEAAFRAGMRVIMIPDVTPPSENSYRKAMKIASSLLTSGLDTIC
jgi:HAD superfamily hydrolase (TIGR01509 family)